MNFLHNRLVAGAISGALGGLVVDINAYLAWQKYQETPFNWGLALSRIVQGAVAGVISALGLGVAA